jgi:hypothetical protein
VSMSYMHLLCWATTCFVIMPTQPSPLHVYSSPAQSMQGYSARWKGVLCFASGTGTTLTFKTLLCSLPYRVVQVPTSSARPCTLLPPAAPGPSYRAAPHSTSNSTLPSCPAFRTSHGHHHQHVGGFSAAASSHHQGPLLHDCNKASCSSPHQQAIYQIPLMAGFSGRCCTRQGECGCTAWGQQQ